MFDFLKKIFQKDKNNMENISNQNTKQNHTKKFEIEIYNQIVSGDPPYEKVNYQKVNYDKPVIIEAASKADLDSFAEKLRVCNQIFKIVRVIDDDTTTQQSKIVQTQKNAIQTNNQIKTIEEKKLVENETNKEIETIVKQKPKFYKIGDIDIKNDNGKIYQKQWLKLTTAESANFRIVNDKTNSIFNLKDKHIEMKRWVLVENVNDNTSEALETDMIGDENNE